MNDININFLLRTDLSWSQELAQQLIVFAPSTSDDYLQYKIIFNNENSGFIIWQLAADEANLLSLAIKKKCSAEDWREVYIIIAPRYFCAAILNIVF